MTLDENIPNQIRKYCHGDHFETLLHVRHAADGRGAASFDSFAQGAGLQSPNEKLNLAGIGAGGQPFSDLRAMRESRTSSRWPTSIGARRARLQDVSEGRRSTKIFARCSTNRARTSTPSSSARPITCTRTARWPACRLGKHVYVEKPLTRTPWEARLLTQAAEKYKVATQMGNQGYSHDATRVACEILWSGEIGEVREVHAWTGRRQLAAGHDEDSAAHAGARHARLGSVARGAAARPFTAGDEEYQEFIAARNARSPRPWRQVAGGGAQDPAARRPVPWRRRVPGAEQYGFYLPFNWRGFYDFGSGLIGDWGVHILGPANWALQLSPE